MDPKDRCDEMPDIAGRLPGSALLRRIGPVGSTESVADGLPSIPVSEDVLANAQVGDHIVLRDAPGRRRQLEIGAREESSLIARADRSVWLESELPITEGVGAVLGGEPLQELVGALMRREPTSE